MCVRLQSFDTVGRLTESHHLTYKNVLGILKNSSFQHDCRRQKKLTQVNDAITSVKTEVAQ